jgi:hypothetical protein
MAGENNGGGENQRNEQQRGSIGIENSSNEEAKIMAMAAGRRRNQRQRRNVGGENENNGINNQWRNNGLERKK